MPTIKKLIEVALPLEAINAESAREKSIRHGHPSTLHLWWSRKPTATARAVIWGSLVDDPSNHPEQFPTLETQQQERERLFGILTRLVKWENSNDEGILAEAKAEIMKSTNGNPPALLDPFAGGGAIPLEAQRLGLEAHAHDLNPVAVMINKAMIEIPPKFAGHAPVNPEAQRQGAANQGWKGAAGLAEDVRYYGEWMKQEACKRIGHLYPKAKLEDGSEATVIAWIWARTLKCPNPACGCEMPLISSYYMSKKKGKEAYVLPHIAGNHVSFSVVNGKPKNSTEVEAGTKNRNEKGRASKAVFCCPKCKSGIVHGEYADKEAENGRMSVTPVCIVAEGRQGRAYLDFSQSAAESLLSEVRNYYDSHKLDEDVPHAQCRGTFASNAQGRYYGFHEFKDYFTPRQLTALTTFSSLVSEAQQKAEADAVAAGVFNDHIALSEGGVGARAYGEAVGIYLAFVVDKLADRNSSTCGWDNSRDGIRNTFGLQAITMTWQYAESNPFCSSSGCISNMLDWVVKCVANFPAISRGNSRQFDAQSDNGLREIMISTDPPYYDNIEYADLSDFFYVWMRQMLKNTYPTLFRTMLVPKTEELVATPYRFGGSTEKARNFFEDGMFNTCCRLYQYAREDIPVTIYYAFKQSETDEMDSTASTGWETMLSAIIRAICHHRYMAYSHRNGQSWWSTRNQLPRIQHRPRLPQARRNRRQRHPPRVHQCPPPGNAPGAGKAAIRQHCPGGLGAVCHRPRHRRVQPLQERAGSRRQAHERARCIANHQSGAGCLLQRAGRRTRPRKPLLRGAVQPVCVQQHQVRRCGHPRPRQEHQCAGAGGTRRADGSEGTGAPENPRRTA